MGAKTIWGQTHSVPTAGHAEKPLIGSYRPPAPSLGEGHGVVGHPQPRQEISCTSFNSFPSQPHNCPALRWLGSWDKTPRRNLVVLGIALVPEEPAGWHQDTSYELTF